MPIAARLADKTLAGGEIHFRAEGPAQGLLLRGAEGLAEDIVNESETSGDVAAEDDISLAVDQPTQAIKLRMDRGRLAAVTRQTVGEAAQGRGARSANGGQEGGSHGARVSGTGDGCSAGDRTPAPWGRCRWAYPAPCG